MTGTALQAEARWLRASLLEHKAGIKYHRRELRTVSRRLKRVLDTCRDMGIRVIQEGEDVQGGTDHGHQESECRGRTGPRPVV